MEGAQQTAHRWLQFKRLPLFMLVGSTYGSALTFCSSCTYNPQVEFASAVRGMELHEAQAPTESMVAWFQANEEATEGVCASGHHSPMRARLRSRGFMQGQVTDGIFPNNRICQRLDEVLGPYHGCPSPAVKSDKCQDRLPEATA